MSTPYVTQSVLLNAPTGAAWSSIPTPQSPLPAQEAEAANVCWRATSIVDSFCNQILRATVDNEQLTGPGAPRFGTMPGTDQFELIMRRWPISEILAIQYAINRPPLAWNTVAADKYLINHPLIGQYTDTASATAPDGGWSIQLDSRAVFPAGVPSGSIYAPTRGAGGRRNGLRLLVSYTNGWPHTSLTADAAADATTIQVDDVTGWVGASGSPTTALRRSRSRRRRSALRRRFRCRTASARRRRGRARSRSRRR